MNNTKKISKRIANFINGQIAEKVFPGAVVAILEKNKVLYHAAFGQRIITPKQAPMLNDTLFDLASLTKPIVIGTLTMQLVESEMITLSAAVQEYLPEFNHPDITCLDLLRHTSGLPAWKPLYIETESPEHIVEHLGNMPLESVPGEKVVYSCLGYILMGKVLTAITEKPLDTFAYENIFKPLGMNRTCYNPPSPNFTNWHDNCAATEDSNSFERRMINAGQHGKYYKGHTWRDGVIIGEVHDENANYLGGVSGNAGIFSNARDLITFCQMILNYGSPLLSAESIQKLSIPQTHNDATEQRSIGWHILPDGAMYHTGFTGTSIRIDLEMGIAAILLTNRVHPDAQSTGIIACRNQFHRIIFG